MKKGKVWAVILVLLLLAAAGAWAAYRWYAGTETITLTWEESLREIANPARGFYYQADTSDGELPEELAQEKLRLMLLTLDLKEEKEAVLSAEKLEELEGMLVKAHEAGVKVIFRAAYGFDSKDAYHDPEDVELVAGHIRQIAPVLNAHKKDLLCVQAGFLGPWGEWHHSNLIPDDDAGSSHTDDAGRNRVLSEWVKALEEPVTINVRRPRYIRDALEAGIPVERLGFHDDALLAGEDDMGTYDDPQYSRDRELSYVDDVLAGGVNGGEMPMLSDYTEPENAVREFERLHLTYLNKAYNEEVLEDWKKSRLGEENAYDVLKRRLGYRLYLTSAEANDGLRDFHSMELTVTLANSGFAAVTPGYRLYAVADTGETRLYLPLKAGLSQVDAGESGVFQLELPLSGLYDPKGPEPDGDFQKGSGHALNPDGDSQEAGANAAEQGSSSQIQGGDASQKNGGRPDRLRIGLLLTDEELPESAWKDDGQAKESEAVISGRIRLANEDILWEDGINYIGQYEFSDGKYYFNRTATARSSGMPEATAEESRTLEAGPEISKTQEEAAPEASATREEADLETSKTWEEATPEAPKEGSGAKDTAGRMRLVFFKIGKADAILLSSEGKNLLIDTGEEDDGQELLDYMDQQGIRKLDALILTHFDKDHVGGADQIVENVEVAQIYQPDYDKDSKQFEEYDTSVGEREVPVYRLSHSVNFSCGGMEVEICPPLRDDYEEENDFSLITSVTFGEQRFLFSGDAQTRRLEELTEEEQELSGGLAHTLLKLPHHGRSDPALESFLDAVNPSYAVITCSGKNPADEEVLALLAERGVEVYLTAEGNVYGECDGETLKLWQ